MLARVLLGDALIVMVFMAFGRLRAGNVRTVDVGGPYDFSQLSTQVNEIMGARTEPDAGDARAVQSAAHFS